MRKELDMDKPNWPGLIDDDFNEEEFKKLITVGREKDENGNT